MTTINNDFFTALKSIQDLANRIDLPENATVQSIRRINEAFPLVDATPEIEERALGTQTYLVPYPNLVLNPDFETDLTSWTESNSSVTATTTQTSAQGERFAKQASMGALEVDVTASSGAGFAGRNQDIAALPTEVWNVEVWVKGSSFTNSEMKVFLEFLDSGKSALAGYNITSTDVSGSFVQLKIENKTAPASTAFMRITVQINVTTTGGVGKAWFDKTRAEKGAATITDRARRIIAGEWVART